MADKSGSLLGLESSIQLRLFDLSTQMLVANQYRLACFWAREHALWLGIQKVPEKPVFSNKTEIAIEQYINWYENLTGAGLKRARENIDNIRSKLNKRDGKIPIVVR